MTVCVCVQLFVTQAARRVLRGNRGYARTITAIHTVFFFMQESVSLKASICMLITSLSYHIFVGHFISLFLLNIDVVVYENTVVDYCS